MEKIEDLISEFDWSTAVDKSAAYGLIQLIRDKVGHSLFDRLVLSKSRTASDYNNPNVLLLEGKFSESGEGEYCAMGVRTASGFVYLAEVVEELLRWKDIATFQYHVASEPLSFYELEENLVKVSMGEVKTCFSHAYSDLTGYLWTNEYIRVAGHDVLKEIADMARSIQRTGEPAYVALRVERKG